MSERGVVARGPRLERVLAAARADTATPAQLQRLAGRLAVLGAVPATGLVAKAAGASALLRWPLLIKLGATGLALVGLTTAGVVWRSSPPPARARVERAQPAPPVVVDDVPVPGAPAPRPLMTVEPPAVAAPVPRPFVRVRPRPARAVAHRSAALSPARVPAPVAAAAAETVAPVAPPAPAVVAASEARRLLAARARLRSDPEGALELVDLHEQEFPLGRLAQERELIAVDALVRLDRLAEARARAQAFRKRYPGSAHLRRLEVLEGAARP